MQNKTASTFCTKFFVALPIITRLILLTILILPLEMQCSNLRIESAYHRCFLHLFIKINRVNGHFYAPTVFLLIEIKRTNECCFSHYYTSVSEKLFCFQHQHQWLSKSYFVFDQVRSVLENIFVSYIADIYQSNVIIFEIISSLNPNM